jgi:hypothetical protein
MDIKRLHSTILFKIFYKKNLKTKEIVLNNAGFDFYIKTSKEKISLTNEDFKYCSYKLKNSSIPK